MVGNTTIVVWQTNIEGGSNRNAVVLDVCTRACILTLLSLLDDGVNL